VATGNKSCFTLIIYNLANPATNGTVVSNNSYNSWGGGSVKLTNNMTMNLPFNFYGENTSFTISTWLYIVSATGVNRTSLYFGETYATNGFRSGYSPINSTINFWSTQSGGNLNIITPNGSVPIDTPKNIVLSFDSVTGTATTYLNGVSSVSDTNKTIYPRTTENQSIGYNRTLDATSITTLTNSILVHHRALTATEILQNYNLTKSKFGL
jgi:hypothetical protein